MLRSTRWPTDSRQGLPSESPRPILRQMAGWTQAVLLGISGSPGTRCISTPPHERSRSSRTVPAASCGFDPPISMPGGAAEIVTQPKRSQVAASSVMRASAARRKPRTSWACSQWSQPGSNRRPPACKAGALPAELWPLGGPSLDGRPGIEERSLGLTGRVWMPCISAIQKPWTRPPTADGAGSSGPARHRSRAVGSELARPRVRGPHRRAADRSRRDRRRQLDLDPAPVRGRRGAARRRVVGRWLEGHFAVEWGERGAQVSLRALVKPSSGPVGPSRGACPRRRSRSDAAWRSTRPARRSRSTSQS